jgi:transposase
MFLRESTQRRKTGETVTYLQFAESLWDAKTKRAQTRIVYNFGRADDPAVVERLRRLARSILRRDTPAELASGNAGVRVVDAWPYGDLYVLNALWERLGIRAIIEKTAATGQHRFSLERALFALVANRATAPCSKLYCYEQWLREDVHLVGTADLALHHLYRAMDFLEAHKDAVEESIFFQVSNLLNLEVDILFYDTTSLHFEVDEEDQGDAKGQVRGSATSGGKSYPAPRKRGYSKNGRSDAPQVVIGLAVSRDGIPVRHWVFPGNTVDVSTVAKVKKDLRGWKLGRCLFVGDAGMVSADNLRTLSRGGGKYLVGMPLRRGDEVTKEVLARPGRYRTVADNLKVKEVLVGVGERRRRYVVCFNPQEAERQSKHREQVLAELRAELDTVATGQTAALSKRVCALRTSGRYGAYLTLTRDNTLVIDPAKVARAARFDGKFVVHSNDDTLSPEDMALGYKQQLRVEEAWRTLKSGLSLRPVFHWAVHRIHAHIALTVLSLLLERVIERECQDTWRNIRDDLRQVKLVQLTGPDGELWQVTDPMPAAAHRLQQLRLPAPPSLLAVH